MLDDLVNNLDKMTKEFQNTIDLNEKMKVEAVSKLSEEDKIYVKSVESVAKKFADNDDLTGLLNYMNSVQDKIKKDASND